MLSDSTSDAWCGDLMHAATSASPGQAEAGANGTMRSDLVYILYTWGYGEFGVLGHGEHLPEHYPRAVSGMFQGHTSALSNDEAAAMRVAAAPSVSAGGSHTLVADVFGRVFACGRDDGEGRLGLRHAQIDNTGLLLKFHQVRTPCFLLLTRGRHHLLKQHFLPLLCVVAQGLWTVVHSVVTTESTSLRLYASAFLSVGQEEQCMLMQRCLRAFKGII
jgi:hypothetical protein